MVSRWLGALVWAAVAASAVAWGLAIFVQPPAAPREARVVDATLALRGDVTRVLGVDAAPAPAAADEAPAPVLDARFQLVGVVAPRGSEAGRREGVALIAVDGKPAKAYRVGATVEGQTVLKAVRARGAELGPRNGAPTIALEIPPPAPAATGTLPPPAGLGGGSGVMPRPLPAPVPPPVGVPMPQPVPQPVPQPQALPQPVPPPPTVAPQPVSPSGGREAPLTR
jgi:general secretion pathway protein C